MTIVPVRVIHTTPQGMLEMSIVENVQREDLNPIERGLAYKRLIDEFGLGTNEVAKRVGKSAPTVSNTIRLLSIPDAIKDALIAGVISEGHVRPLISLGESKLMLDLFKKVLREKPEQKEEFRPLPTPPAPTIAPSRLRRRPTRRRRRSGSSRRGLRNLSKPPKKWSTNSIPVSAGGRS